MSTPDSTPNTPDTADTPDTALKPTAPDLTVTRRRRNRKATMSTPDTDPTPVPDTAPVPAPDTAPLDAAQVEASLTALASLWEEATSASQSEADLAAAREVAFSAREGAYKQATTAIAAMMSGGVTGKQIADRKLPGLSAGNVAMARIVGTVLAKGTLPKGWIASPHTQRQALSASVPVLDKEGNVVADPDGSTVYASHKSLRALVGRAASAVGANSAKRILAALEDAKSASGAIDILTKMIGGEESSTTLKGKPDAVGQLRAALAAMKRANKAMLADRVGDPAEGLKTLAAIEAEVEELRVEFTARTPDEDGSEDSDN